MRYLRTDRALSQPLPIAARPKHREPAAKHSARPARYAPLQALILPMLEHETLSSEQIRARLADNYAAQTVLNCL